MAVITLSRQVGSGGDAIAQRVCELLGYHYFDKNLMTRVAADVGLSEREVVDYSEENYHVKSFFSTLLGSRPVTTVGVRQRDTQGKEMLTVESLDEEQCITFVRSTIEAAHASGNVLIVGRGGQAILQDAPDVLHVLVIAPQATRVENYRRAGWSGISEIKRAIHDRDRATDQYLSRFFDIQWDDPLLYHLVINTGQLAIDAAAYTIATAARQLDTAAVG